MKKQDWVSLTTNMRCKLMVNKHKNTGANIYWNNVTVRG
jgi:hypothetical protein